MDKLEKIEIPGNPFWDVFARFGRDEAISMIINVAGTYGASSLMQNEMLGSLSRNSRDIILSTTGPIVEKAGFFPGNFYDAYKEWRATPKDERDNYSVYLKRALKASGKSLVEDLFIHDPLYVLMLYNGLQSYPDTPAWLLSLGSFVGGVFCVAGLETCVNELRYKIYKRKMKKTGFGLETYLESRFHIRSDVDPEKLIEKCQAEFGLSDPETWIYNDRYFTSSLPEYSNRRPKIRLRHRTSKGRHLQSAQVVYTRAVESKRGLDQYRYFPTRKDKFYFSLESPCEQIEEIENEKARKTLHAEKDYRDIEFERTYIAHPDVVLVSSDGVRGQRPYFVVEIKSYKEDTLRQAMRYVMREFPVVQTTNSKLDLLLTE